jgi:hypothetical protein
MRFRAGRGLRQITSAKELEILWVFCAFCFDRKWASENVATGESPRNIKPNDVQPLNPGEGAAIIKTRDLISRKAYERSRSRTMILTLRHTALRIGDVAMLGRDQHEELK